MYFLLIHCESRENSGCHTYTFISQLLAFGNDFGTNNFQKRATILPHDICCFFCCVLVTPCLTRQITDSMSTQKTINKTSHLCMLYQTAVWHRWWKRKINLPPDLKLSSFFSLQRQRQSKNSAFMTPFASGSCLTGNSKISGKMIRSSQSMWVKIDARINVSLSHTEVYNDNDPCSLKNSLLGNRHGDIPKILHFIGGWLLTQGQMFFLLSIFL